MNTLDLIALAKECPDLTISVKASDLIEASRAFKAELLQDINLKVPDSTLSEREEFRSREETMETLRVSSATLWRWKKSGFLVPVPMGSMDRYRQSDIDKIMKQRGGTL